MSNVFEAEVEPPVSAILVPSGRLFGTDAGMAQGIERSQVDSCRIDVRRNITAPLSRPSAWP
ncbi:hypothetical protein N657DRAFT_645628 [Parathielavia appendiculata]|uniref:Uncharacterized protein n=1 Tax=Parathielavia appendiculata TaxID=2587402 RepID=A0AAN6U0B8_9PEZI|nr:hypothetical protein N657DRAFT_645628 [Parathielavia appendiculata]